MYTLTHISCMQSSGHLFMRTLQIIVCYVFYFVAPCALIEDKGTCQVHVNSSDSVWNDSTSSCLGPDRAMCTTTDLR